MIFYRLHIYRSQISSLLANNRTSRSRFMRLFVLASLLTVLIPVLSIIQLINFVLMSSPRPYNWKVVHEWNYARLIPSPEVKLGHSDRWCWIVLGYCSFLTIGMGDEMLRQYHDSIEKIGLGRFWPTHRGGKSAVTSGRRPSLFSSLGSKGKLLFAKSNKKDLHRSGSLQVSLLTVR
jgi:pheromone a factor receptor